jgi:hypothetical protein
MLINSRNFDPSRRTQKHLIVLFSNDENDWEIGIFAGIITRAGESDPEISFLGRGINEHANIEHEYKFCRVSEFHSLPTVLVTHKDGTAQYERIWGSSNPSNYITFNNIEIKRKDYEND